MTTGSDRSDELEAARGAVQYGLIRAGLFSLAINVLLLAPPLYMLQVYDRVLSSGHVSTLLYLTLIAFFALLFLSIFDAMRLWLLSRLAAFAGRILRGPLVDRSVKLSLEGASGGAQPLRDLRQVQGFIGGQGILPLLDAPFAPLFILVIMLTHMWLGVVAIVAAAILFGLGYLNESFTRASTQEANVGQAKAINTLDATVRNAEAIEAMGMLSAIRKRFSDQDQLAGNLHQKVTETNGLLVGGSKFVRLISQVLILGVGAALVLRGEITAGSMIFASIILGRGLAPFEQAMSAWKGLIGARSAYERIAALMTRMPTPSSMIALPEPEGRLSAQGVFYTHRQGEEPLLRNLTFDLEPGEVLGLVGPSGAGKTTLCRLLAGILPASVGHIRLDGAELSKWPREQVGRHIGYLPQNVELFAASVSENIARLEDLEAEVVVDAAKQAGIHELILNLPNGYETQVGEGGHNLSAGQRQRIGLARALLRNPRLIILDEPNSNLDHPGDVALERAIRDAKQTGAAIVLVAHRQGALSIADKLLVLQEGMVRHFGPKDEVLKKMQEGGAGPMSVVDNRVKPA